MPLRFLLLLLPLLALAGAAPGQEPSAAAVTPDESLLGHPGYLIISAARDTTAGYRWLEGPGPGQHSLTWLDGMLTVPDSLVLEPFGERDLAVPVTAALAGAGAGGKLHWTEGTYAISEPLMATDGIVQLLVSGGELEILGTRVRYRPPPATPEKSNTDMRASLLMLSGIILLIAVLMRRARRAARKDR